MKKKVISIICVGLILGFAGSAFAQLLNSGHDFSDGNSATTGSGLNDAWNTLAGNKMCGPCHTPHGSNNVSNIIPLWAHQTSTTAPWFPYVSPTLTLNAADLGDPTGVSLACLSCHDTSINIDAFFGAGASTTAMPAGMQVGVTGNLAYDHPVSFNYTLIDASTTIDVEIRDDAALAPTAGTTISSTYLIAGTQVECASCHDVHNTPAVAKLLKLDNTNSQLCLECHIK